MLGAHGITARLLLTLTLLGAAPVLAGENPAIPPTVEARALTRRLDEVEQVLRQKLMAQTYRRSGIDVGRALALIDLVEQLARHLQAPVQELPAREGRAIGLRLRSLRAKLEVLRLAVERKQTSLLLEQLSPARPLRGGSTGQIRGHVVSDADDLPVPAADVFLYRSTGTFAGSVAVSADGSYSFPNLAPGKYFVLAFGTDAGLANELYQDQPCGEIGGASCVPTSGTPVPVAADAVTEGIDFRLSRGAVLAGRLKEVGTLTPIAGQEVRVFSSSGASLAFRFTDSAGRFRFTGVAPGTYFVRTSSSAHQNEVWDDLPCPIDQPCNVTSGTPIQILAQETRADLDFELERLGVIEGTVVDARSGEPLYFGFVFASGNPGGGQTDMTDANGRYRLGGLRPGTYRVRAFAFFGYQPEVYDDVPCPQNQCDFSIGTPIPVALGSTISNIDFALDRLGEIHGRVTEQGGASLTHEAQVVVVDSNGDAVENTGIDINGVYEVVDLEPGSYQVITDSMAYRDEVYDDVPCELATCPTNAGTPVATALNVPTTGIDFDLERLAIVRGRVTEQGTGQGLEFGDVRVWNAAGQQVASQNLTFGPTYEIVGLPAGTHFVTADTPTHVGEVYADLPCEEEDPPGCDPTLGTPLNLTMNGELSNIDFVLERRGEIAGRIIDAVSGAGLSGFLVSIWAPDGSLERQGANELDGNYRVTGLANGTHFVTVNHSSYGDVLYNGIACPGGQPPGCNPVLGTPVLTTDGAVTSGIDMALEFDGRGITGTVSAQGSGVPLAGVAVDLWLATGQFTRSTTTNAAGRYQFTELLGSYFVSTDANLGTGDELWNNVSCPMGPASLGLCNPLLGTAVVVPLTGVTLAHADFELSILPIFADGFETGDVSAWSGSVP